MQSFDARQSIRLLIRMDNEKCHLSVSSLLEKVNSSIEDSELVKILACLIERLRCNWAEKQAFYEARGVQLILGLIRSRNPLVLEHAFYLLGCASSSHDATSHKVANSNTFDVLANVLKNGGSGDFKLIRAALFLLSPIAASSELGHTLTQTSGCLKYILIIFENMTEDLLSQVADQDTIITWSILCTTIKLCVNPFLSKSSQLEAASIIPKATSLIDHWVKESNGLLNTSMNEMFSMLINVVFENEFNQHCFTNFNGIHVIIRAFLKIKNKCLAVCDSVINSLICLMDAVVRDNIVTSEIAGSLSAIQLLLELLNEDNVEFKLFCLTTLVHLVTNCKKNKEIFVLEEGITRVKSALEEAEAYPEITKTAYQLYRAVTQDSYAYNTLNLTESNKDYLNYSRLNVCPMKENIIPQEAARHLADPNMHLRSGFSYSTWNYAASHFTNLQDENFNTPSLLFQSVFQHETPEITSVLNSTEQTGLGSSQGNLAKCYNMENLDPIIIKVVEEICEKVESLNAKHGDVSDIEIDVSCGEYCQLVDKTHSDDFLSNYLPDLISEDEDNSYFIVNQKETDSQGNRGTKASSLSDDKEEKYLSCDEEFSPSGDINLYKCEISIATQTSLQVESSPSVPETLLNFENQSLDTSMDHTKCLEARELTDGVQKSVDAQTQCSTIEVQSEDINKVSKIQHVTTAVQTENCYCNRGCCNATTSNNSIQRICFKSSCIQKLCKIHKKVYVMRRFSEEEINNLTAGIKVHGTNFEAILKDYSFHSERTHRDLYYKWKNMSAGDLMT